MIYMSCDLFLSSCPPFDTPFSVSCLFHPLSFLARFSLSLVVRRLFLPKPSKFSRFDFFLVFFLRYHHLLAPSILTALHPLLLSFFILSSHTIVFSEYYAGKQQNFNRDSPAWGTSKLISLKELKDDANDFLVDDTLELKVNACACIYKALLFLHVCHGFCFVWLQILLARHLFG